MHPSATLLLGHCKLFKSDVRSFQPIQSHAQRRSIKGRRRARWRRPATLHKFLPTNRAQHHYLGIFQTQQITVSLSRNWLRQRDQTGSSLTTRSSIKTSPNNKKLASFFHNPYNEYSRGFRIRSLSVPEKPYRSMPTVVGDRRDGLLFLDEYSNCASLRRLLQTSAPRHERSHPIII